MHGIMFAQLEQFAIQRLGARGWEQVRREANQAELAFRSDRAYPDAALADLLGAACRVGDMEMAALLESFGGFIVPKLMEIYQPLLRPEWRTLEVIEHVEETIHKVVRLRNLGAEPPRLRVQRHGPQALSVIYTSKRRLCHLALGIVRGIGEHFGQGIEVAQPSCMLRGDAHCQIEVQAAADAR